MNKIFLKTILFIAAISFLASCDKDFNNVGAEIVGDDHFGMEQYTGQLTVDVTQKNLDPIESDNLDTNLLGFYANPASGFGSTTANFATQVQLASVAPTIDPLLDQKVQSVTLYIPYTLKSRTATATSGSFTYELDGLITSTTTPKLSLSVFENGQDMNTVALNPVAPSTKFFTDQDFVFDLFKIGARLNEDAANLTYIPTSHNDDFSFSATEHQDTSTTPPTYIAPGIRINLNKDRFKQIIFNPITGTTTDNLKDNANFTKYFKGLYFKTAQNTGDALNMIDFKRGTITIKYTEKTSITDSTPVDKSIVLNLTGNTISLLKNSVPVPTHADRIVLKGGEGSVAKVDLFGIRNATTGKFADLENLKNKNYLINEANLVFYADQSKMTGSTEPTRLFLYDLRNRRPIIDYYFDGTTSTTFNNGKFIHGGIKEDVTIGGITYSKYKIRLTNHIRNIVSKDSTNVSLGLTVCYNINNQAFKKVKTAPMLGSSTWNNLSYFEKNAFSFPVSSLMSPLGTILYNENAANTDKRARLEIWYTKPN